MLLHLILFGLIAGLFSLVGGFVVLWLEKSMKPFMILLMAFAAGAFLAVSFLDILPEAVELVSDPHNIFIAALAGFFIFFAIERIMKRYVGDTHSHEASAHSEHSESLAFLVVIGDSVHNFLDGIVIALAFVADPSLGLITALAVAAHEIPQEIGDFAILLDIGWKRSNIILVNVLSSLLAVVGILVGYYAGNFLEQYLPYLLAGVAGTFIYLAASDLIPEIQDRSAHAQTYSVLAAFFVGVVIVGYLVSFTHT